MANRIKKKEEAKGTFRDRAALVMGIFILIVLCVFPLVVGDKYFDILETKYQFYCACAIGAAAVMFILGLISGKLAESMKKLDLKGTAKGLSIPDWAMLAFWLCSVISWLLCSDWRWDAFWGTLGRYNGVFLTTIYMVVYFLLTRFFRFRQWYLDAFLAAGILVCLFGITDYFQMDIMGFKEGMVDSQKGIYVSTLGNINTYTVFVGAVMAVSMVLFCLEKNSRRMFWYLGVFIIADFALVMGTSDNAYLTLAALFGFSPLWLFKTGTGLRRYVISMAVFVTVLQCIDWINGAYGNQVLGIEGLFSLLTGLSILPVLLAGIWLVAGVIAFFTMKKRTDPQDDSMGKGLIYGWLAVIAAVVLAVVFVLYDANFAGHADRYEAVRSYVVFDDQWGTERGYVWRRSFELYNHRFTILQKLFGYGPDMFAILMTEYYDGQMMGDMPVIYDSAHNEYIHYLLTLGLTGAVSYIVFLLASIRDMCRSMKNRPEVAAAMFAVAAYAVQAIVNINLPITMPIILSLLAMGLSRADAEA